MYGINISKSVPRKPQPDFYKFKYRMVFCTSFISAVANLPKFTFQHPQRRTRFIINLYINILSDFLSSNTDLYLTLK